MRDEDFIAVMTVGIILTLFKESRDIVENIFYIVWEIFYLINMTMKGKKVLFLAVISVKRN